MNDKNDEHKEANGRNADETQAPRNAPRHQYYSLAEFIRTHERMTVTLLLVLVMATTYYTFLGAGSALDSDGGGMKERLSALVYAVGASAGIYLFWRYAFGIIPPLASWVEWTLAITTLIGGCVVVACISSWMNVQALAGAEAQKIEMYEAVTQFEAAQDAHTRHLSRARSFKTNLEQGAAELRGWANAEARRGAVSGIPGRGTVYGALNASADHFTGMAQALEGGLAEADALAGRAREHLSGMRSFAESRSNLADRLNGFAAEADRLRAALVAMESLDLAGAVARELDRIAGSAVSGRPSARSGAIARAQSSALARVQEIKASIAAPLARAAAEMAAEPLPEVPQHRRISTSRAVFKHFIQLVPYWAGGIGMDLMPVFLIFFLSILRRAVHPKTGGDDWDNPEDGVDMTIREVNRARKAMDKLMRKDDKKNPPKK